MKIAIRSSKAQALRVIRLLESLGGDNSLYHFSGYNQSDTPYTVDYEDNNYIKLVDSIDGFDINDFKVFTIKEFTKKYPYVIGDKVLSRGLLGNISAIRWDNTLDEVLYYIVWRDGSQLSPCRVKDLILCRERYIDLGLSVLWADRNLGADSPDDDGDYISPIDLRNNYKVPEITIPSYDDFSELINKCTWSKTVQNGVDGFTVEGKTGNKIFFPAAGWYSHCEKGVVDFGITGNYWGTMVEKRNKPYPSYVVLFSDDYGIGITKEYDESGDYGFGPGPSYSVRRVLRCTELSVEECASDMDDCSLNVSEDKNYFKYPTSLEECMCRLGISQKYKESGVLGYGSDILNSFQTLLICRDAYWKTFNNWSPNWEDVSTIKYTIELDASDIVFNKSYTSRRILSFPTEEMCEIFFERFYTLILKCRDLWSGKIG